MAREEERTTAMEWCKTLPRQASSQLLIRCLLLRTRRVSASQTILRSMEGLTITMVVGDLEVATWDRADVSLNKEANPA